MSVYVADADMTLHHGEALAVLATLPEQSVHCVVTSPPYWGLRDYGTATWQGGSDDCQHLAPGGQRQDTARMYGAGGAALAQRQHRGACPDCGALRTDEGLGLETTPDEYVGSMVDVFREVRRVLRDDGCAWLNIGDTYASTQASGGQFDYSTSGLKRDGRSEASRLRTLNERAKELHRPQPQQALRPGVKPKDLVGIPWRVAFALQADGWWLRSDVIWSKPNQMPESVTDRPTKAHEYVFLLTKRPAYYWDQEAVREPTSPSSQFGRPRPDHATPYSEQGRKAPTERLGGGSRGSAHGRNMRSVWEITTTPYPGAHFAVMPTELARRCILASTSEQGCCPRCGAPWSRIVAKVENPYPGSTHTHEHDKAQGNTQTHASGEPSGTIGSRRWHLKGAGGPTLGWRPGCEHDDAPVPCVVLDPFAGAGTTALAARALGRHALLIELSADYCTAIAERLAQLSLLASAPPPQMSLLGDT